MKLSRIAWSILFAGAACLGTGEAAAAGDYGLFTQYLEFAGLDEKGLGIVFYGGYAAGSFGLADFSGDYRVALGTSESFEREASLTPEEEGRFFLIDLSGGARFGDDRLQLVLRAGALAIWGDDAAGHSYQYLQGRAGIGLARRIDLGRVTLAAEGGVFLALAYLEDRIDLGDSFNLQGMGVEGGLAAALPLGEGRDLLCGFRISLTAGRDFFAGDSVSGQSREIAAWLGVSF